MALLALAPAFSGGVAATAAFSAGASAISFGTILSGLSTAFQVIGGIKDNKAANSLAEQQAQAGADQATEANFRKQQLDQEAGQDRAKAQRRFIEIRRRARVQESKALALASASGGGVDHGINNLLAGITGRGALDAYTTLYEGEESARSKETQGDSIAYSGYQGYKAGKIKAKGTVLAGRANLISTGAGLAKGFAEKYAA